MDIIWEIKEFIENLCETKSIPIDLRFACLGDMNKFYQNGGEFSIDCISYYAKDVEDIKQFFIDYIDILKDILKDRETLYNKIALYIEDIVDMNGWYDVIADGALFEDVL